MENQKEKISVKGEDLMDIVFVNVKIDDEVIINDKEPIVILEDILQPVVKLENCVWLKED